MAVTTRVSALVDLQGFIQSIATQRLSGELVVAVEHDERRIRFANGSISALTGMRPDLFSRALCWAGVITRERMHPVISALPPEAGPQDLLRALLAARLIDRNGALDALDVLIEEEFTTIFAWPSPRLDMRAQPDPDAWAECQVAIGLNVNASALLLESLRRQDELATLSSYIPSAWDSLLRVPTTESPADLPPDARTFLADWRDGIPCGAYLESYRMPPFRATMALVALHRANLIRTSTPGELMVQADAARHANNLRKAYGLYRRVLALGHDVGRVHLQIAELAEQLGDTEIAAERYLSAAEGLNDLPAVVAALRAAMRMGADREKPLTQLASIATTLGRPDDAVNCLLELAKLYERRKSYDQAVLSLREAQGLGADPAVTGLGLARLAQIQGDHEQAALQYELSARALQEADRLPEALAAWGELLRLQPQRLDYARECADLLVWSGHKEDALDVLRRAIAEHGGAGGEQEQAVLLGIYEMIARLDPSDVTAHDWLAKVYERQRNRDGAAAQLRLAANAQEKSGDDQSLARTLERILDLDSSQSDVLDWLARVRLRLNQERLAGELWGRAADAMLARGQRHESRELLVRAVASVPADHGLRARLALAANRDGDRAEALRQYLAAADVARGTGDLVAARDLLVHAGRMRPDDLVLRVRLAELADATQDPQLSRHVAEVVRLAVRSSNFGIGLEWARRRVVLEPTVDARSELVELLRRTGDHAAELNAGQELVADLLTSGGTAQAVDVLSRLVASHPRDPDLALQLAEAHNSLGDAKTAVRCYRHAVVLMQADGRTDDALLVLDELAALSEEAEVVAAARDAIGRGMAVDWDRIRLELTQGARRKAVEGLADSGAVRVDRRPPTDRSGRKGGSALTRKSEILDEGLSEGVQGEI